MYTAAWTASAVRTSSPTTAITHDQAYPNTNATPMPPQQAEQVGLPAESDGEPDDGHQHEGQRRAEQVGEGPSGEHGDAGHRQRPEPVDAALGQIVGQARRGAGAAEQRELGQQPGHEPVDVLPGGGRRQRLPDRAAEHVGEHPAPCTP